MMPEEEWERHGNCDNTIFPCGAIADDEKKAVGDRMIVFIFLFHVFIPANRFNCIYQHVHRFSRRPQWSFVIMP